MKFLLRVLPVLLVLCLVAACSDQEPAQSDEAVQEQTEAAAPDAAQESTMQADEETQAPEEAAGAQEQAETSQVDPQERLLVIDSCAQSEGTTMEMCTCVVDGMIAEFSQDEFALMVAAVKEDPDLPDGVPGIDEDRINEVLMGVFEACGM